LGGHRAAVEDGDVGIARRVNNGMTGDAEHLADGLGVVMVRAAPERAKVNSHVNRSVGGAQGA
jgi:hypothetical protein